MCSVNSEVFTFRFLPFFFIHRSNPSKVSGPNSRSVLWNAMINPLINLTINGVIWYQGEANRGKSHSHSTLPQFLILVWNNQQCTISYYLSRTFFYFELQYINLMSLNYTLLLTKSRALWGRACFFNIMSMSWTSCFREGKTSSWSWTRDLLLQCVQTNKLNSQKR